MRLGTIRRDRRTGRQIIVQVRLQLRPFNREGVHKMLLGSRLLHSLCYLHASMVLYRDLQVGCRWETAPVSADRALQRMLVVSQCVVGDSQETSRTVFCLWNDQRFLNLIAAVDGTMMPDSDWLSRHLTCACHSIAS